MVLTRLETTAVAAQLFDMSSRNAVRFFSTERMSTSVSL